MRPSPDDPITASRRIDDGEASPMAPQPPLGSPAVLIRLPDVRPRRVPRRAPVESERQTATVPTRPTTAPAAGRVASAPVSDFAHPTPPPLARMPLQVAPAPAVELRPATQPNSQRQPSSRQSWNLPSAKFWIVLFSLLAIEGGMIAAWRSRSEPAESTETTVDQNVGSIGAEPSTAQPQVPTGPSTRDARDLPPWECWPDRTTEKKPGAGEMQSRGAASAPESEGAANRPATLKPAAAGPAETGPLMSAGLDHRSAVANQNSPRAIARLRGQITKPHREAPYEHARRSVP